MGRRLPAIPQSPPRPGGQVQKTIRAGSICFPVPVSLRPCSRMAGWVPFPAIFSMIAWLWRHAGCHARIHRTILSAFPETLMILSLSWVFALTFCGLRSTAWEGERPTMTRRPRPVVTGDYSFP